MLATTASLYGLTLQVDDDSDYEPIPHLGPFGLDDLATIAGAVAAYCVLL